MEVENKKRSSIIDVPRIQGQDDLFGIERYQDALCEFIKMADTPMTIALQGEWGSGKTSLMNTLRFALCDDHGAPFYGIWLNTWQHSLMNSPENTLIKIIEGLTADIIRIISKEHETKAKEMATKALRFFKKASVAVAKIGAERVIGGGGDVISALAEGGEREMLLNDFKEELGKAINELIKFDIEKNTGKKGILFFIDDLDRIDPPVAVNILELLKNIFDLQNCVFILAIDYDVVIKGLKPKFGELTPKNEREFRSFFDKIIQLPFAMPVASYQIERFLAPALKTVGYLDEEELNSDENLIMKLAEFANLSVGTNPRALKRLTNTLSLINLLTKDDNESDDTNAKMINFALVCMQIAYPHIYNNLIKDPDFLKWDAAKASQMKLKPLSEDEQKQLEATTEFDEAWEKVLFQMCQQDTYSSNRAFQISKLLNKIREIVNDDENLGETVEQVLELSAVTNLVANDQQKVIKVKTSDYLKVIKNKLVPVLKPKVSAPFDRVEQQGKRVVTNLYLKFSKKDWHNWIVYQLRAEREKPFIDIGADLYICSASHSSIHDSIESAGKKELLDQIVTQFTESKNNLSQVINNFGYWMNPESPNFLRVHKKKTVQALVYFRIYFNSPNEVITDEFIENISEVTTELLKLYKIVNQ